MSCLNASSSTTVSDYLTAFKTRRKMIDNAFRKNCVHIILNLFRRKPIDGFANYKVVESELLDYPSCFSTLQPSLLGFWASSVFAHYATFPFVQVTRQLNLEECPLLRNGKSCLDAFFGGISDFLVSFHRGGYDFFLFENVYDFCAMRALNRTNQLFRVWHNKFLYMAF